MPSLILGDFEPVLVRSLSELPGILLVHAKSLCQEVFSELCRESWVWQEDVSIALTDGVSLYDLTPVQANTQVIGVVKVLDSGGLPLDKDVHYRITSGNQLELLSDSITGPLLVCCIIQPTPAFVGIPEDLQDKYTAQLIIGVKARAMLEVEKQWSSPQMGMNYQDKWERLLLATHSNVKEGFTVTRQGRPHSPRSFYY